MAKKMSVDVKCKFGKFEKTVIMDYTEPENFEEAIEMDGEKKAFSIYLNKRKTNHMDKIRKKEVTAMQETIMEKMKEMGIEL